MSINSKLTGPPHFWSDGLLSFYLSCSTHWVGSWVDHIHVLDHCKKYNVGYVAMHIIVMANPSEPKYGYCCILCLFRIKHKDVKEIIYSSSYYVYYIIWSSHLFSWHLKFLEWNLKFWHDLQQVVKKSAKTDQTYCLSQLQTK